LKPDLDTGIDCKTARQSGLISESLGNTNEVIMVKLALKAAVKLI
jgi:hypothetical protein